LHGEFPASVKYAPDFGISGMENLYLMKLRYFLLAFIFMLLAACVSSNDSGTGKKPVYVKPSIDYKGKFGKGYVRMPVSTKKNAIKNQNHSRYYYETRGKYRSKKD
jgi:hypothetical protein